MRKKLLAGLAITLGLVGSALVLGPASPAAANLGLYRVSATSPSDSTSPKTITVRCNPGDKLSTVGGSVSVNEVLLTRAYADTATDNLATAGGIEAVATAANWTVSVYGICVPAGMVSGITVVQATLGPDTSSKYPEAVCPNGKVVLGGGFKLEEADGRIAVDELRISSGLTSVQATSYAYGVPVDYSFSAQAICASRPAVHTFSTWDSAWNSVNPKTESTSACGANAQVSGSGFALTGALGAVGVSTLNPKLNQGTTEAVAKEISPYSGDWELQVQTICIG